MLWLMDMDAIDQAEYKSFLHLKELRNSYAHKLADHVWSGVSWDDLASFDKLFELYTKIDQWWINEVEIPVAGVEKLSDEEAQSVSNSALFILKRMRLTLYGESQNR